MRNNQAPTSVVIKTETGKLNVHSIFYTIQGEGPFAGRPAIFVRLAGCNLQCPACDTEYTDVDTSCGFMEPSFILDRLDGIVRNMDHLHFPLIVLTGGEPFRQHPTGAGVL